MGDKVDIACLCGRVNQKVQLKQTIPVKSKYCHCNTCRYTFGGLCHSALEVVGSPGNIEACTKYYDASVPVEKYFCSICGSHVFQYKPKQDRWDIKSGAVDKVPSHVAGRLEHVIAHQFVEDTKDGGLSVCFTGQSDPVCKFFAEEAGASREIIPKAISGLQNHTHDSEPDQLRGSCHCGGVQFFLTRPNEFSKQYSSPWADLIVPYHSSSPENKEDVKWWIRGDKWLAGTCACRSCRLGLGAPIQAWTFVSLCNIFNPDGSPMRYDFGTIRSYESSPEKYREFCSCCGATIFWHCAERPGVVDVSVGILRADEGARAASWLSWWTDRVSFSEEALDTQLIRTLSAGLQALST